MQTDGARSEIPWGAPALVAMGNFFGVVYHTTVARDLVQFLRDVDLPILLIEIEPGIAHTYRIELYPDWYAFYIDAYLIDEGVPEGPFPAYDSQIAWLGSSWEIPCENAWDYIRYGVIPVDASADYDSDGNGKLDGNWAVEWQNANPGKWYDCYSAHSQPLNANLKAYAAWWLWAKLTGWTDDVSVEDSYYSAPQTFVFIRVIQILLIHLQLSVMIFTEEVL